jgi:hypothetical protein
MIGALMPVADLPWGKLEWKKDPPAAEWDHALAELFGHPLQSCLWGDARRHLDGIVQHRWLARRDGEPIWMIRVEERRVLGGKIAWAPRGPTGRTPELGLSTPPEFESYLRTEGFAILISDPWIKVRDSPQQPTSGVRRGKPQTIWLDLSVGKEVIFENFHKHVRNGVRRAGRGGVHVETTRDPVRIAEFADLCERISAQKGFELRVTSALIGALLNHSTSGEAAEAALFVALKDGKFGAGLLILRVGRSVHLIGAGTNRDFRQERVGEACHWGVIEWAIARSCTRYDLEGIDPINNHSGYEFKKRLGGGEVMLSGHLYAPLTCPGRVMAWLIRRYSMGER